MIKVVGSLFYGLFKLMSYLLYLCGGGSSVRLLLFFMINLDDVGIFGGDVLNGGGDAVFMTTVVVVMVCLVVEGMIMLFFGMCILCLFFLWKMRRCIFCSVL